jgi:hypothetical protein
MASIPYEVDRWNIRLVSNFAANVLKASTSITLRLSLMVVATD